MAQAGDAVFDERRLRLAELDRERSQALLRHASDGIHIIDREGRLTEASDAFCSMLGYAPGEMVGMRISQWDARLDESRIDANIEQLLLHRRRLQFETTHRRKDGSLFDVEVSCSPVEIGGHLVMFNSSRDISERKQAELALRLQQRQLAESEARYRELLENLHTAIVVHAPDTSVVFSNPRASALLGMTDGQMRNKRCSIRPGISSTNTASAWRSRTIRSTACAPRWNRCRHW